MTWVALAANPYTAENSAAAAADGYVWVFNGDTVTKYDAALDSWTVEVTTGGRTGIGNGEGLRAVEHGGYLYLAGGRVTATNARSTRFDRLDPATLTWVQGTMPVGDEGFSLHSVGDYIYKIGGFADWTTVARRYHVPTSTWSTITAPPGGSAGASFIVTVSALSGTVIHFFGIDAGGSTYDKWWTYDTATDTWNSAYGTLNRYLLDGAAWATPTGDFYTAGGNEAAGITGRTDSYTAGAWTSEAALSTGRRRPAYTELDGVLYFIQGGVGGFGAVSNVDAFTVPTVTAGWVVGSVAF